MCAWVCLFSIGNVVFLDIDWYKHAINIKFIEIDLLLLEECALYTHAYEKVL